MAWWERKKRRHAIAYYRHSAEGRQENSIEIQRDQVRVFAERNDIEIVAEYEDAGKSGLNADGRPGFQAVLAHVKRRNIDFVLCLDMTRWGRFQNIDLAAAYESECAQFNVKVVYTAHGDLPETTHIGLDDDALFFGLRKSMERTMAGKYSADLSKKVFAGAVKVSQQGNRAGGTPPFGMLRFEVDEQRNPIGVMQPKQHKSYPNNRVRLVPDDAEKADIVRDIFTLFVVKDWSESQIVADLIDRNIPAPRSGKWTTSTIRRMLQNEQYAGSVVYNRTSAKLKTKRICNPPEKWIVTPNSYQPIITPEVFEAARLKLGLSRSMSRDEMQNHLRSALTKYHSLSYSLMRSLPEMPRRFEIIREFGSLPEAIQSLFPDGIEKTRQSVQNRIATEAKSLINYEDFLVINEMFTIKIAPAIPIPCGYGHEWYFRIDHRPCVDITLGVALYDSLGSKILGFFPFPCLLTQESLFCISHSSKQKIMLYGYADLQFIVDLIRSTCDSPIHENSHDE
ncbi:MAG: recombinase family protein [Thermoguttaceae bacterium]